jgi:hypothetical protein
VTKNWLRPKRPKPSVKRWAYSGMPSFSSHSVIYCDVCALMALIRPVWF